MCACKYTRVRVLAQQQEIKKNCAKNRINEKKWKFTVCKLWSVSWADGWLVGASYSLLLYCRYHHCLFRCCVWAHTKQCSLLPFKRPFKFYPRNKLIDIICARISLDAIFRLVLFFERIVHPYRRIHFSFFYFLCPIIFFVCVSFPFFVIKFLSHSLDFVVLYRFWNIAGAKYMLICQKPHIHFSFASIKIYLLFLPFMVRLFFFVCTLCLWLYALANLKRKLR